MKGPSDKMIACNFYAFRIENFNIFFLERKTKGPHSLLAVKAGENVENSLYK